MKKIKRKVSIVLMGLLISGCASLNNNSNSSSTSSLINSASSSTTNNLISSTSSDVTSTAISSTVSSNTNSATISNTSSNITSSSSSNSSVVSTSTTIQSSGTSSVSTEIEKTLVITPSNFNKISNIELSGVVENTDYPQEFTFNTNGVMKSNKYKGLKEIEIHVYSTYENLYVYNNYNGSGTALKSQSSIGNNESTYNYKFNGENEFYIKNTSSTYRTHVYSITITYTGVENTTSGGNTTSSSINSTITSSSSSNYESDYYDGTYYNNVNLNLTGTSLKSELRELITDTHDNPTSYDDLRTAIPKADASLKNPSKVVLIYSRTEVKSTWDGGTTWNREHVWPKANGWFDKSGAGSDLHHIRPEDPTVNSNRGNTKFGTGSSYFEPVDEAKGDVARIIFYLLTRYSQSDSYGVGKVAQSMEMLLQWNKLDPVDALEIQRNEVAEDIQGNRNPFIDYPELAEAIW